MSRLTEIEARLRAATSGPWVVVTKGSESFIAAVSGREIARPPFGNAPSRDDAELIANAPDDLAWCVDQIAMLRGLVMKLAHIADPADGYPPEGRHTTLIRYADIWSARRALGLTAPPVSDNLRMTPNSTESVE